MDAAGSQGVAQREPDDVSGDPRESSLGRRIRALQRLKAFPVIVDLLEDRVQSRTLSVVVFTLLFVMVLRLAMVGLFLYNPPEVRACRASHLAARRRAALTTATLHIEQFVNPVPLTLQERTTLTLSSASTQHLNRDIFPAVTAVALSSFGVGVPNVTVVASVTLQEGQILNEVYGLQGTLASLGGVMYEEVLSLPRCVSACLHASDAAVLLWPDTVPLARY